MACAFSNLEWEDDGAGYAMPQFQLLAYRDEVRVGTCHTVTSLPYRYRQGARHLRTMLSHAAAV